MEIKKTGKSLLDIISGNDEISHIAETVAPIISDLSERPLIPDLTGDDEPEKPEKPAKNISEKAETTKKAVKTVEMDDDGDGDDDGGEDISLTGEAAAPMLTIALDMLQARGASLISKRDYHQYKFSKVDKKEFEKSLAAYLATTNFRISPLGAFLTVAFMMIGGNLAQAYEDKIEDKEAAAAAAKAARLQAEQAAMQMPLPQRREPVSTPFNYAPQHETPIVQLPKPIVVAKMPGMAGRRKFQLDDNGKFKFDKNGVYIKVDERKESPTPEITRMVRAGKTNKEILDTIAKNG